MMSIRTWARILPLAAMLLMLPLAAFAQCTLPSDGLVGHWKLDETSGSTAADSMGIIGNSTAMTNFSLPAAWNPSSGTVDGALDFDGDAYVAMPSTNFGNRFSISLWVRPDYIADGLYALVANSSNGSATNGFRLLMYYTSSTANIYLETGNGSTFNNVEAPAPNNFVMQQWNHVIATVDRASGVGKIYVNGVEISSDDTIVTDFNNSGIWHLGAWTVAPGDFFNGLMDDVRVYNRVLSAAEAAALYSARSTAAAPAGYMTYDVKHSRMMYCDGTQWVHAGTGSYNPNAVYFDGLNTYLTSGGTLTGVTDGQTVTMSFWLKSDAGSTIAKTIMEGQGTTDENWEIRPHNAEVLTALGDFHVTWNDTTVTPAFDVRVGDAGFEDGEWHHVLFSFDLANTAKRHMVVDGVLLPEGTGAMQASFYRYITTATLEFTPDDALGFGIGAETHGSSDHVGALADVWVDFNTYIDLSLESNRRKFISASGMPMYLGPDGSIPTGAAPDIFLSGTTDAWHTNKGAGGGFTENGTLATAASQPGDSLISNSTSGSALENSIAAYGLSTATSHTQNLGFTPTAGRLLVAIAGWDKDVTGITEPSGEWTQVASEASGLSVTGAMYYKIAEGDETVFSLSWTNLRSAAIWVGEFSGVTSVAPFDKSSNADSANANVTSISTGTTAALAQANEIAIAMVASDTGSNLENGASWSNGFKELFGCPLCDDPGLRVAYKNVSSTSGVETTYSASDTGDQAIAILATFKADGTESASACTSGSKGRMLYDFGFNVMKYCNGAEWVAMGPVGGTPSATGLTAHWMLDETSGAAVADSAGSYNGTWVDGANNDLAEEAVTGKLGGAIDFAGSKRVTITGEGAAFSTNQFTNSAWIYRTLDTGLVEVLLDNQDALDDGWTMLITALDTLRCGYNATVTNTPTAMPITANSWWHFACVADGTMIYTYVNGVLLDAEQVSGSISESMDMRIGSRSFNTAFPFTGYIDDVRVYNRALSAQEITQLYNYGVSGGLGDVSGNCSNPSRPEGNMFYNIDHNVLQYCNGERWIGIGQ